MQNLSQLNSFKELDSQLISTPFPHHLFSNVFEPDTAVEIHDWLENTSLWEYTKTDFYTQFEFSLIDQTLPATLSFLNSSSTLSFLATNFSRLYNRELKVVDITVHKLVDSYRMGIHNDYIGSSETHRLVIQINGGWQQENGGYLMLFNSNNPKDVSKIVKPISNTGVGFEISQSSYHAVSTVYGFCRYTIGYTFNDAE